MIDVGARDFHRVQHLRMDAFALVRASSTQSPSARPPPWRSRSSCRPTRCARSGRSAHSSRRRCTGISRWPAIRPGCTSIENSCIESRCACAKRRTCAVANSMSRLMPASICACAARSRRGSPRCRRSSRRAGARTRAPPPRRRARCLPSISSTTLPGVAGFGLGRLRRLLQVFDHRITRCRAGRANHHACCWKMMIGASTAAAASRSCAGGSATFSPLRRAPAEHVFGKRKHSHERDERAAKR